MKASRIRVARLGPHDAERVTELFAGIVSDPSASRFHPHPFNPENARRVCFHRDHDIYAGAFLGDALVGYGMLRGWDEGFTVPALGIYLVPGVRGSGIGRQFMDALHGMAFERGATRVMLKVYPDNEAALELYRRIGYVFDGESNGQLAGRIDLSQVSAGPESSHCAKETE